MRYEIGSPTDEKPAPNKTARRRPMAARPSDHINEAELPNARLALIIWKTRRSLSLSFSLSPSPSLADSPAALCHFHIPANYCCRTLYFELDPPLIAHNWPLMSKVFGRSANNAHFDTHTTWTSSLSISPSLCIMSFSLFHASDRMREREREAGREELQSKSRHMRRTLRACSKPIQSPSGEGGLLYKTLFLI